MDIISDKHYTENKDLIIIKPKNINIVPADCPVCNLAMRNLQDVLKFKSWNCCEICYLYFAYPNKEKWKNGWRPAKEEINRVSYL